MNRIMISSTVLCFVLLTMTTAQAEEDRTVRIAILHGPHQSYRKAASLLESSLNANGYYCKRFELPPVQDEQGRNRIFKQLMSFRPVVIATAGTSSTTFALSKPSQIPVIFFMVPNAEDAVFMNTDGPYRTRIAGVTTNVSPEAQMDWIARFLPNLKRLCILYSERTLKTVTSLQEAARKRGIEIITIRTNKKKFLPAIAKLKSQDCDGLLMIPDSKVYNSATVQRVLLWGLRQKKPVLGFSANIVRAGAWAGQYTDTESVVKQTAELVRSIIGRTKPQEVGIQHPRRIQSAINQHTAGTIRLPFHCLTNNPEIVRYGEEP